MRDIRVVQRPVEVAVDSVRFPQVFRGIRIVS
jgi:hypothetical protein